MATAKVDTVTGLVQDVNDAWETTAHTGGEIIPIKEEEEEGKRKYGIVWEVDETWVSMSLTGQETLYIQDKQQNSERLDEGQEGGWHFPSEYVLIYGEEPKQELPEEKNCGDMPLISPW